MLFDHWTYNQFYMERTSWSAEQTDERVAKALIDRYENYSQVLTEKVTYV